MAIGHKNPNGRVRPENGNHRWSAGCALFAAALAGSLSSVYVTDQPAYAAMASDRASSALFAAIRANDLTAVKRIITAGANPRARDDSGVSAPQAAVRLGHLVIAHYLLSHRSDKSPSLPSKGGDQQIDKVEPNELAETAEAETLRDLLTTGPIETDPTTDLTIDNARTALPIPPRRSAAMSGSKDEPATAEVTELQGLDQQASPPIVPSAADQKFAGDQSDLPHLPPGPAPSPGPVVMNPADPTESVIAGKPSDADTVEHPASPLKKGLLARAADWINGLFGGTENTTKPEQPTLVAKASDAIIRQNEQPQPPATPSQQTGRNSDEQATLADAQTGLSDTNLAQAQTPPAIDDLEKVAADSDPALQSASPELPDADLPRVLADAPRLDDPLAKTLAQPDSGISPLEGLGQDPLADLNGEAGSDAGSTKSRDSSKHSGTVDLTTMTPKDRLAWLDALLARPLVRNADRSLDDSREEALDHLRTQAKVKDAAEQKQREQQKAASAHVPQRGQMPGESSSDQMSGTDLSSVEGPKPGTNTSRRLKIPLPPPDPNGRRSPSRDPWFRDVSPDEPYVRAAHRSRKAPPPERGTAPPPTPAVPQLTGQKPTSQPSGADGQKLAQNVPEPPPIRETPRPAAATEQSSVKTPGGSAKNDGLDAALSDLEKEFASPAGPNDDRLAADLGATPADKPTAKSDDPLADLLGDPPAGDKISQTKTATDDPLADLLGDGPADGAKSPTSAAAGDPLANLLNDAPADAKTSSTTTTSDPLTDALNDLADALDSPARAADTVAAQAAAPSATAEEILSVLPKGSQVKLFHDGRPALPAIWSSPIVLPGQQPPLQDLASAYIVPAAFRVGVDQAASNNLLGDLPVGANATTAWPVTKIEMADGKTIAPPKTMPDATAGVDNAADGQQGSAASALANQGGTLENVTLSLGTGTSLYNTFVPKGAKGSEGTAAECIEKAGGRTQVCIVELTWPAFLEPRFLVSTILYTGTNSIIRFDDGAPTRMHVVYNAPGFDEITDWMVRRFGPPSKTVNRSIAPFGQARRDNPSMIWRALDKVTQKTVSLEVRKFDDTRDGFPDIRNGVIMLYLEGAPEIFPQVSIHELMRLKRTG